jgi:hypothetical protein
MRWRVGWNGVLVAGFAGAMSVARSAGAQPASPNTEVAAESLFEDARTLVAAGKYAEACPKFADSERLGPSVATLLNLANCWEKLGRTASAWATFREAASAANAAGRKEYLSTALRRADALAPKLARLTLTVPQPVPGLQVKRDGVAVDAAEWGAAIPVDPGAHSIEASAPGRKPWTISVEVAQDGAQASATVPSLEELPADAAAAGNAPSAPSVAVTATTPAAGTANPDVTSSSKGGSGQRIAGAVVAGVGVAAVVVGGVVGLVAKGKYNDSLSNCETSNPNLCSQPGLSQRDDARSAGDAASVLMIAGAAAVVAGAVVWFTAPSSRPASAAWVQVSPTLGGLVARGAW